MKFALLCFLNLCFTTTVAMSQTRPSGQGNLYNVIQNEPVSVYYQSIDELLTDKILNNVFSIQVSPSVTAYHIYCNVLFTGVPNENLAQQIGLKLSGAGNQPEHRLHTASTLLLDKQADFRSGLLSFDAIIHGQTTRTIEPGNYDFYIQFTIIQP
jgi:hypothetical protein